MSVHEQFDIIGLKAGGTLHTWLAIPPNFYAIAFGLVGLARVWHLAGSLYGLPAGIGDALFLVAALVFLLFFAVLVIKLVLAPKTVLADLADARSEEHTSELQSHLNLVCRLLLEKKKTHLPHVT